MASPTVARARPRARRIALRVAGSLLLLVLAAFLGVATWFYAVARGGLPQVDGTIRLRGLSAPVTVTRDRQGVPHIVAATADDLFFAQGFVTAQDRLWQM